MIVEDKRCYFCRNTQNLHIHHCLHGTANRAKADKYGLTVYLCAYHHNLGIKCVHNNAEMDMILKKEAQKYFENKFVNGRELWMKEFGKNYL